MAARSQPAANSYLHPFDVRASIIRPERLTQQILVLKRKLSSECRHLCCDFCFERRQIVHELRHSCWDAAFYGWREHCREQNLPAVDVVQTCAECFIQLVEVFERRETDALC